MKHALRSLRALSVLLAALVVAASGCDSGVEPPPDPPPPRPPAPTAPVMRTVRGDIQFVHDPVVIKEGVRYYLFSTGPGVPIRCSVDLVTWTTCGSAFDGAPQWAREQIAGVSDLWAPDISYFDGEYHLYYSASTFGRNTSGIGLATTPTLDQSSPEYAWTDHGPVVRSFSSNDYNAIDGNVVLDEAGTPWLSFGSYWTGIKLVELDPETGKTASDPPSLISLARRPRSDSEANAIEAPYIIQRDGYYYLFVSFDACCDGVNSTYNIRVGRSESVTGPYVDQSGRSMLDGGGTLIINGTPRWKGTGHQAVLQESDETLLIYHAYDAQANGVPTLRISPLEWEDGWPSIPLE